MIFFCRYSAAAGGLSPVNYGKFVCFNFREPRTRKREGARSFATCNAIKIMIRREDVRECVFAGYTRIMELLRARCYKELFGRSVQ